MFGHEIDFDGNAGRGDSVIAKMIKLGKTMYVVAQGFREHVRLGSKLSETVKGKLSLVQGSCSWEEWRKYSSTSSIPQTAKNW
ncbi:hypothetical protein ACS0TY_008929 [Phlomoides rotata]